MMPTAPNNNNNIIPNQLWCAICNSLCNQFVVSQRAFANVTYSCSFCGNEELQRAAIVLPATTAATSGTRQVVSVNSHTFNQVVRGRSNSSTGVTTTYVEARPPPITTRPVAVTPPQRRRRGGDSPTDAHLLAHLARVKITQQTRPIFQRGCSLLLTSLSPSLELPSESVNATQLIVPTTAGAAVDKLGDPLTMTEGGDALHQIVPREASFFAVLAVVEQLPPSKQHQHLSGRFSLSNPLVEADHSRSPGVVDPNTTAVAFYMTASDNSAAATEVASTAFVAQQAGACALIVAIPPTAKSTQSWACRWWRGLDGYQQALREQEVQGLNLPVIVVKQQQQNDITKAIKRDKSIIVCNCTSTEATTQQKANDEDGNCPICLEDFELDQVIVSLDRHCGHCFHQDCAMAWLHWHNTCPYCRMALPAAPSGSPSRQIVFA